MYAYEVILIVTYSSRLQSRIHLYALIMRTRAFLQVQLHPTVAILTRIFATHSLRGMRPARATDRLRNFLQYLKEHAPSRQVAPHQMINLPNSHFERLKSFERPRWLCSCVSLIRHHNGLVLKKSCDRHCISLRLVDLQNVIQLRNQIFVNTFILTHSHLS